MTATHLSVLLHRANVTARSSDSPAVRAYWLTRAAELSRELGLVVAPFEGFVPATMEKRQLRTWVVL